MCEDWENYECRWGKSSYYRYCRYLADSSFAVRNQEKVGILNRPPSTLSHLLIIFPPALKLYGIYSDDKIDKLVWERVAQNSFTGAEETGAESGLEETQALEVHELLTWVHQAFLLNLYKILIGAMRRSRQEKFVPYSEPLMKSKLHFPPT